MVISHDHCESISWCKLATDRSDDHLDQSTIHEIEVHHGAVRYLVPSGVGNWFRKLGILSERVIELGWWEEMTLDLSATASPTDSTGEVHHQLIPLDSERGHSSADLQSDTVSPGIKEIRIVCTPAQHNSGRNLLRKNKSLWATWLLEWTRSSGDTFRCFFGGYV